MSEQLNYADGVTTTTTVEVTDFYMLGKWLGSLGSDDQARFLEGLSATLTLDHDGEMQAAYIGTSAREQGAALAIHKLGELLAAMTAPESITASEESDQ